MPETRETKEERNQSTAKVSNDRVIHRLHEVERRMQALQNDLANLIGKASQIRIPGFGNPQETFAPFSTGPTYTPSVGVTAFPMPGPAGPAPPSMPGFGPFGGMSSAVPSTPSFGSTPWQNPWTENARTGRELSTVPPAQRQPNVNLLDDGNEYVVQCELPGVKKDSLDIVVYEHTISLNARTASDPGDGALILGELVPVVYRRTIALPSEVNAGKAKANFKDGVLTLRVPKSEPTEKPRRLDVAYS